MSLLVGVFRRSGSVSRWTKVFSNHVICSNTRATGTGAATSLSTRMYSSVSDLPRLEDKRVGSKMKHVFSEAEFEKRLANLRSYMSENSIEASVFTSIQCINYYSGFVHCTFGRPFACIVTQERSVLVTPLIDGSMPWRRGHGDNIVYTDWQRDNFYHAVQEVLKDTKGKIGCEFDHQTLDTSKKLDQALLGREKVDIGWPCMLMRLIKSEEELDVIRHGARIADIGGTAMVEALGENVPEHKLTLAATAAMVQEIADTYPQSDLMDVFAWFHSGINTDGAHNPVTTRRVQKGDVCSLNCFPMIQGYHASLERTAFLDHATDDQIRMWQMNCEVHRTGIQAIRPGAICREIAAELNDIYRKYDALQYRSFGYGYSFGILCHYYGRESALELREDVDTVIKPGMVISMVPMIVIPEGKPGTGAYREHDILIVTETGTENITKFPYGPDHMILKK